MTVEVREGGFRDSVAVTADARSARMGVLVVISEGVHAARYLRKLDSQVIDAFGSMPGPVATIRKGTPSFACSGLLAMKRYRVAGAPKGISVPVIPMVLGGDMGFVDFTKINGLVVAGMGTGSLSDAVIDQLSPSVTGKMPVVISTRCAFGDNYDDFYYKGSLEKYTSRGFLLQGYEGLSAYQARIRLILELAEPS